MGVRLLVFGCPWLSPRLLRSIRLAIVAQLPVRPPILRQPSMPTLYSAKRLKTGQLLLGIAPAASIFELENR